MAWDSQGCPPCSWDVWNPQDPSCRGPVASMPCLEVGGPHARATSSRGGWAQAETAGADNFLAGAKLGCRTFGPGLMVSAKEALSDVVMGMGGAGRKFDIAKAQHLVRILGYNDISEWPRYTGVSHCLETDRGPEKLSSDW